MLTSRKTFLPFALPSISEDAIEEVAQVLRSGWVTSGPKVKQFEMEFGDFVGSKEAIAVNSATAGLHLALEAIGLTSEDAAITSSVTFTATTEVICYFGAEPILTDVDSIHNLMTPETLKETIESKCKWNGKELKSKKTGKHIKAIMPVHLAGHTCDMEGLLKIAKEYNLYVIEDAAHAFPAVHKNKMIGNWGDFTVFSFYATKGITTGEGGMVTTSHKEAAERIRKMRLHGINRDAFNRPGWYYEVVDAGYKYNMTDIAAALGVVQLKESHGFWERRTEIAKHYNQEFSSLKGIKLPKEDPNGIHSWHLYRIELDPKIAKVGRDTLVEELKERNIGTSLHFIPIFEHPYYKKTFQYNRKEYPNACSMYDKSVSLPLFAGMTKSDEKDVIDAVKDILG
ncbi:DegT/DnrJ/EryC1/StrS aminotransferase family protein [Leptospira sp. 85282-16]|uniref:DegT/DnrJ/EryC1/StrS aminotransferase family protein n=1 Tax=Leptospira montravelensis TaxID=2484961 RepID=A0ABY2LSI3_9LEPT|nr:MULTISPECIES: DegT/DnrJ/EryC1/StrS aminotransferase family protein [Leptospira]MCT8334143.1 DegT/DnrJ/EryC1/StrS aminotransferase family protein [Leptospira sp. 85282-16]TGK80525.1 DegT/DnrJ/EryC1/StrS aminotransferase family protein [Leptospira montravelensis]TGL00786.1 DegT/DnrJ/EryC1/StrS aminotransferase family protein [Leptospira montravelensis]